MKVRGGSLMHRARVDFKNRDDLGRVVSSIAFLEPRKPLDWDEPYHLEDGAGVTATGHLTYANMEQRIVAFTLTGPATGVGLEGRVRDLEIFLRAILDFSSEKSPEEFVAWVQDRIPRMVD